MISQDENYTYFKGYKVPRSYAVPPNYSVAGQSTTKGAPASQTTSENAQTGDLTSKELSPEETAAIALGMAALFGGGVLVGRLGGRPQ